MAFRQASDSLPEPGVLKLLAAHPWSGNAREVEEVALSGTPLGSMAETSYLEWDSSLESGDTMLLMSDGFPELLSGEGEVLGYGRARARFEEISSLTKSRK